MSNFNQAANQAAESHHITKRIIPNGAIVNALLYEIGYTKSGKEVNSILGGIQAKFAYLSYEFNNERTKLVDFDEEGNVIFPYDRPEDGKDGMPGLLSKPIYLSPGVLKYKQISEPQTVETAILLYSHTIALELGPNIQEPFGRILLQSGLVDLATLNLGVIGIDSTFATTDVGFPIIRAFRNTWMAYEKKDVENGKPKIGAEKRFNEKLTTWDRTQEPHVNVLAEFPVEYMPSSRVMTLYTALRNRQDEKNAISNSSPNTGFGSEPAPF